VKPSSNKIVKVVTSSDMSKKTLISDIVKKIKVSGLGKQGGELWRKLTKL
jgi:hypothetical protein